jgi:hypothetical protein
MEQLLRERLWVARLEEKDVMRWWWTDRALGPDGDLIGRGVLPQTQASGCARIAMTVAPRSFGQRYMAEPARHLFRLSATTEEALAMT